MVSPVTVVSAGRAAGGRAAGPAPPPTSSRPPSPLPAGALPPAPRALSPSRREPRHWRPPPAPAMLTPASRGSCCSSGAPAPAGLRRVLLLSCLFLNTSTAHLLYVRCICSERRCPGCPGLASRQCPAASSCPRGLPCPRRHLCLAIRGALLSRCWFGLRRVR